MSKKRSERRKHCARAGCSKVPTPPARPPQTGPITIHCAAMLSSQCNNGRSQLTIISKVGLRWCLTPETTTNGIASLYTALAGSHAASVNLRDVTSRRFGVLWQIVLAVVRDQTFNTLCMRLITHRWCWFLDCVHGFSWAKLTTVHKSRYNTSIGKGFTVSPITLSACKLIRK